MSNQTVCGVFRADSPDVKTPRLGLDALALFGMLAILVFAAYNTVQMHADRQAREAASTSIAAASVGGR